MTSTSRLTLVRKVVLAALSVHSAVPYIRLFNQEVHAFAGIQRVERTNNISRLSFMRFLPFLTSHPLTFARTQGVS
jgi:hypothetical protein